MFFLAVDVFGDQHVVLDSVDTEQVVRNHSFQFGSKNGKGVAEIWGMSEIAGHLEQRLNLLPRGRNRGEEADLVLFRSGYRDLLKASGRSVTA